ncbi:hypothetical protein [Atopomonas sediminilitoris]|uniref:hypothetical protein n=1 Tax=Atopomonas sediminilitoris TaxID=2919919 RepID=UPI001F4EB7FE|nr:hypothetical protein [Atopomonas sediminilitoris]MCJ8170156.1 hypothetical protein [Atopomonas sediminilitoris]
MAQSIRLPWFWLFVDLLGTVAVGLGLAEWFAEVNVVPEPLRIEYLGPVLVGAGLLLMLPALWLMLAQLHKAGR